MVPDATLIERLEAERFAAMLAKDAAALDRLLHDDLVYMHSSGVADTKASYIAGLRDGVWDYHAIEPSERAVRTHDALALVYFRMRISMAVRGVEKEMDNRALAVWVPRDGTWQLIGLQSGSVPVATR